MTRPMNRSRLALVPAPGHDRPCGAHLCRWRAQVTAEQQSAIRASCRSDFMSKCSGVTPGGKDALVCLQKNVASLSPACKTAVSATIPAPAQAAPAPAEAKPAQAARARRPRGNRARRRRSAPAPPHRRGRPSGRADRRPPQPQPPSRCRNRPGPPPRAAAAPGASPPPAAPTHRSDGQDRSHAGP